MYQARSCGSRPGFSEDQQAVPRRGTLYPITAALELRPMLLAIRQIQPRATARGGLLSCRVVLPSTLIEETEAEKACPTELKCAFS
jgi:hypothetical protein